MAAHAVAIDAARLDRLDGGIGAPGGEGIVAVAQACLRDSAHGLARVGREVLERDAVEIAEPAGRGIEAGAARLLEAGRDALDRRTGQEEPAEGAREGRARHVDVAGAGVAEPAAVEGHRALVDAPGAAAAVAVGPQAVGRAGRAVRAMAGGRAGVALEAQVGGERAVVRRIEVAREQQGLAVRADRSALPRRLRLDAPAARPACGAALGLVGGLGLRAVVEHPVYVIGVLGRCAHGCGGQHRPRPAHAQGAACEPAPHGARR